MQLFTVTSVDRLPGRSGKKKHNPDEPKTVDVHGEDLVAWPCLICQIFDLQENLTVYHIGTKRRHEVAHGVCMENSGLTHEPCKC